MFRVTVWLPAKHDVSHWQSRLQDQSIATEVRACKHGRKAVFRDGEDAFDEFHDDDTVLPPKAWERLAFEHEHGCDCDYRRGKEKSLPVGKAE